MAGGPFARVWEAAAWLLLAVAAVAALTMLAWPIGHDQGIFALNGATVASGGRPYADAFETRGPLAFWSYAALSLAFGPRAWGLRVVDLACTAATAWLLARAARPFVGPVGRHVLVAAWLFAVVSLGAHNSAQFELWIGEGLLAGLLLVTRPGGYRGRDLAGFGAIVGLATLTKPFFPLLLAVAGVVVVDRRRADLAAAARELAVLAAGCAAPVAVALGWLWALGAFPAFWEAHVRYTLGVYPSYGVHQSRVFATLSALLFGRDFPSLVAVAASGAGLGVLWRRHRALALGLGTWLAGGVLTVALQGRFYLYHWTLLLPAALLLAAVACAEAARGASGARPLGVAVGAALVAQAAWEPLRDLRWWAGQLGGRRTDGGYYARAAGWLVNPADERDAAHHVRARTRPGTPVGMWAVNAAVAYLADRPNATRFSERRTFSVMADHPLTRRYRAEYESTIVRCPPAYFVENTGLDRGSGERTFAEAAPDVFALVRRAYVPDATFGTLRVWRRADVASHPAFGTGRGSRCGAAPDSSAVGPSGAAGRSPT